MKRFVSAVLICGVLLGSPKTHAIPPFSFEQSTFELQQEALATFLCVAIVLAACVVRGCCLTKQRLQDGTGTLDLLEPPMLLTPSEKDAKAPDELPAVTSETPPESAPEPAPQPAKMAAKKVSKPTETNKALRKKLATMLLQSENGQESISFYLDKLQNDDKNKVSYLCRMLTYSEAPNLDELNNNIEAISAAPDVLSRLTPDASGLLSALTAFWTEDLKDSAQRSNDDQVKGLGNLIEQLRAQFNREIKLP